MYVATKIRRQQMLIKITMKSLYSKHINFDVNLLLHRGCQQKLYRYGSGGFRGSKAAAEEPIQNWGGYLNSLDTFVLRKLQSYGVTLKVGGLQPPSSPLSAAYGLRGLAPYLRKYKGWMY